MTTSKMRKNEKYFSHCRRCHFRTFAFCIFKMRKRENANVEFVNKNAKTFSILDLKNAKCETAAPDPNGEAKSLCRPHPLHSTSV